MSTPPAATAPGLTRAANKTRIETAIKTALNPTSTAKGWQLSRFHFDEFGRDTAHQQSLSFVVAVGGTRYNSDRQTVNRAAGPLNTWVTTEVRVKLATQLRASSVVADGTKHQQWVGAVLRAAMAAAATNGRTLYRNTNPSAVAAGATVAVTEHVFEIRHILPLE